MLKRVSEDERIEGTTQLVYGPAGTGKTFYAGSAGDDWILMSDRNGVATVKSKLFKDKVGTDPFLVEIHPDESPTLPALFDSLRNQIDGFLAPAEKNNWRGIILDDINTVRIGARNKAIQLNGLAGRSKTSGNAQSGKFKDILLPTIADFGTEMGLVESFLRQMNDGLRSEGKHCIVCAHERLYRKEGSNTVVQVKPLFTGTDTPDAMPGIFDLVWYLRIVGTGSNVKREFVTETEGGIMAKTRWGGLFKQVERDITAKEVFDRIEYWQKEGKVLPSTNK
jgi:hypothetical protein